jgi:hypothetical protein
MEKEQFRRSEERGAEGSETRLARGLDSMGPEYDPGAEGLGHREFIPKVAQLEDGLSPKPSP